MRSLSAPEAIAFPLSRMSSRVASRTTSSKSCVTRIKRDVERPSQLVDLILQSPSHRSIDGSKRLVEQQHGRLASQCARERHALTLAS